MISSQSCRNLCQVTTQSSFHSLLLFCVLWQISFPPPHTPVTEGSIEQEVEAVLPPLPLLSLQNTILILTTCKGVPVPLSLPLFLFSYTPLFHSLPLQIFLSIWIRMQHKQYCRLCAARQGTLVQYSSAFSFFVLLTRLHTFLTDLFMCLTVPSPLIHDLMCENDNFLTCIWYSDQPTSFGKQN